MVFAGKKKKNMLYGGKRWCSPEEEAIRWLYYLDCESSGKKNQRTYSDTMKKDLSLFILYTVNYKYKRRPYIG